MKSAFTAAAQNSCAVTGQLGVVDTGGDSGPSIRRKCWQVEYFWRICEACRPSALAADPVTSTAPTAEIRIWVRQKTHVYGGDQRQFKRGEHRTAAVKTVQQSSETALLAVSVKIFWKWSCSAVSKKNSTRERTVAGAAVSIGSVEPAASGRVKESWRRPAGFCADYSSSMNGLMRRALASSWAFSPSFFEEAKRWRTFASPVLRLRRRAISLCRSVRPMENQNL